MGQKKSNNQPPMNQGYQSIQNPTYSGRDSLILTEIGLPNYSRDILTMMNQSKLVSQLENRSEILEFGAGSGYLAELWLEMFSENVKCVEIDFDLSRSIEKKGFQVENKISDFNKQFDLIYSSNVLEHIEDDISILKEIYVNLKPGGVVAIYVPAFQILFSSMDKEVGHVRRYSKKELSRKIEDVGFINQQIRFSDSVGFIASLLIRIMGYRTKFGIGNLKSLLIYDNYIFPVSKFLDRIGFAKIIGKNLIVIAKKPINEAPLENMP